MNRKLRILAGLLAVYFLTLPLSLVVHVKSHIDTVKIVDVNKSDNDVFYSDSTCDICSLYFDQQLYNDDVQYNHHFNRSLVSHTDIVQLNITVAFEQIYLRGPPLV